MVKPKEMLGNQQITKHELEILRNGLDWHDRQDSLEKIYEITKSIKVTDSVSAWLQKFEEIAFLCSEFI